jgi:outer membrane protein OmpA-like peptidoglycan-associated protein
VKPIIFTGVLIIIAVWCDQSPAGDCHLAAEYYYRARSADHPNQSIEWLQRSSAVCPNFNAFYVMGLLYRQQGQRDQAMQTFRQARTVARSAQTEALALGRLGQLLSQTDRLPHALSALALAEQLHPPPAPAWLTRALKQARLKSTRRIMTAAVIAALLNPDAFIAPNGRFSVRPAVNLPVHFDYDRADLNASAKRQVFELGKALAHLKTSRSAFLLVGHTDKRGSQLYNQILSEKRAGAVKLELEKQFPSLIGHLKATGRGESQLLYDGDDETDHRLNRRVKVSPITNGTIAELEMR